MSKITTAQLFKNIKTLVEQSKQELYIVANTTLTETYFHIGRLIVEYEQQGSNRAEYAKETLINLSAKLTAALGKGFSVDNLENMRKFYVVYKEDYIKHISKNQKSEAVSRKSGSLQKSETLSRKLSLSPFKLSWSHYIFLSNIENAIERKFYTIETTAENWSFRELKRQYESALFERLALSRNKAKVKELSKKGHVVEKPSDAIKAAEESKTIGIILCKNKKESTIKYTLGKGNKQIFASKYKVFFSEKQIFKLIREQ